MKLSKRKMCLVACSLVVGAVLFGSGVKVGAATSEPGGMSDPLITESYLTQQLDQLNFGYECVTLAKGKTLKLSQGAQMMIYTGSGSITGSLIDMTNGSLATSNAVVERYHLYLAPADGSGITATSACVVFICGEREE